MTRATVTITSVLALTLCLIGCSPSTIDSYCLKYKSVTFSASKDTPETVRQVRENNAVFDNDCK